LASSIKDYVDFQIEKKSQKNVNAPSESGKRFFGICTLVQKMT